MSHNLYFKKVGTDEHIEFPIQLSTKISREINNLSNIYDKLYVIEIYLYGCQWKEKDIDNLIFKIGKMLENKLLTLEIN